MSEEPNPPPDTPTGDPEEKIDLGYEEDREGERDVEEGRAPVHETAGDPLELDRPDDREGKPLDEYDQEELEELSPRERGELEADEADAGADERA